MKTYLVTLRGESREVYAIEAESEDDAVARWEQGSLEIQECYGMELESVQEDD